MSDLLPLGVHEMQIGDNLVNLHLVGRDSRSTGLNLDLIELVLEKQD